MLKTICVMSRKCHHFLFPSSRKKNYLHIFFRSQSCTFSPLTSPLSVTLRSNLSTLNSSHYLQPIIYAHKHTDAHTHTHTHTHRHTHTYKADTLQFKNLMQVMKTEKIMENVKLLSKSIVVL